MLLVRIKAMIANPHLPASIYLVCQSLVYIIQEMLIVKQVHTCGRNR